MNPPWEKRGFTYFQPFLKMEKQDKKDKMKDDKKPTGSQMLPSSLTPDSLLFYLLTKPINAPISLLFLSSKGPTN